MPSMTTVGDQGKAQCGLAERDSPPERVLNGRPCLAVAFEPRSS